MNQWTQEQVSKITPMKIRKEKRKKVNKTQIVPVHLRDAVYHVKVKPGQERGKRLSQNIWRVAVLELCKLEQAESNTHLNTSEPNYWKSNRRKDLRQEKKVTHREAQILFLWIRDDLYSKPHIVHSQIMIVLWEQSLLFECSVFSKTRVSPADVSLWGVPVCLSRS